MRQGWKTHECHRRAEDELAAQPGGIDQARQRGRRLPADAYGGGEPLKLGFDATPPSRERLAEFLWSCGLSLGEQCTPEQGTDAKRAWGGFATAIVK